MEQRIVIPRKKFEMILQTFKTIWTANKPSSADTERLKELRNKNQFEISDDEAAELTTLLTGIRIGEVPDDKAIEKIFYSFFGFTSQMEVIKFVNDSTKRIWVKKNFGSYEVIPDKQIYLTAMREAFSPFLFISKVEQKANSRALEKRSDIVKSFFEESMHFTECFEYDQDDWEVYPLKQDQLKQLIDNKENRVLMVINKDDDDTLLDKYPVKEMGYDVININRANSMYHLASLKQADLKLDGKLFRTRVVKGTNMDLLGSLILKSQLMGAKWVVEISEKLEKHKNFRDRVINLANITDITIVVK